MDYTQVFRDIAAGKKPECDVDDAYFTGLLNVAYTMAPTEMGTVVGVLRKVEWRRVPKTCMAVVWVLLARVSASNKTGSLTLSYNILHDYVLPKKTSRKHVVDFVGVLCDLLHATVYGASRGLRWRLAKDVWALFEFAAQKQTPGSVGFFEQVLQFALRTTYGILALQSEGSKGTVLQAVMSIMVNCLGNPNPSLRKVVKRVIANDDFSRTVMDRIPKLVPGSDERRIAVKLCVKLIKFSHEGAKLAWYDVLKPCMEADNADDLRDTAVSAFVTRSVATPVLGKVYVATSMIEYMLKRKTYWDGAKTFSEGIWNLLSEEHPEVLAEQPAIRKALDAGTFGDVFPRLCHFLDAVVDAADHKKEEDKAADALVQARARAKVITIAKAKAKFLAEEAEAAAAVAAGNPEDDADTDSSDGDTVDSDADNTDDDLAEVSDGWTFDSDSD
jgi:hypothetical protein